MGWCSGTELFDEIMKCILEKKDLYATIKKIIDAFEDMDWDCQNDSEYWNHELVQRAMKELHPDWFEEEIEEFGEQNTCPFCGDKNICKCTYL